MASVKENLIAAKALIDTPEKWITGSWGNGTCFCALGAVRRVAGHAFIPAKEEAALIAALPAEFIAKTTALDRDLRLVPHFNDTHLHAEVMALFARAIEAQP